MIRAPVNGGSWCTATFYSSSQTSVRAMLTNSLRQATGVRRTRSAANRDGAGWRLQHRVPGWAEGGDAGATYGDPCGATAGGESAREPYRGSRNCMADNNFHPLGPLPYVRMKSIRSVPAPFTSVCEPVTTAVSPVMRTSDLSVVSD